MTNGRTKREARRATKERETRWMSHNSYGRLFEPGQQGELRRELAAKVQEGLTAPVGVNMESVLRAVDDVISERAWGWHFALSRERLRTRAPCAEDGASRLLCADCTLPGCCHFDIVRLTSNDVRRLSARLKLSAEEFVARHCMPYGDARDRRYTHALKNVKPCAFLGEDGRCGVYLDRPTVCAEFPFVVDQTTGDITKIRLFPFCNVPFNVVRWEVTLRVLDGSV